MSNQDLVKTADNRITVSARKAAANRRNAGKSTGPKSAAGKTVVAANAVRHGLLSWRPIVHDAEQAEDWDRHLQRTLEALTPHGHLEALLAERLALLTWRLNRLARYEAETLASEQSGIAGRTDSDDAPTIAERTVTALEELGNESEENSVDPQLAAWVIETVAARAGVVLDTDEDPTFTEPAWFPRESALSDFDDWTAGRLREYLGCVAAKGRRKVDALWDGLISSARRSAEVSRREKEAARLQRIERSRVVHLLMPAHKAQPLQR